MRDISQIEEFCDAMRDVIDILEDMDDETLEAINDKSELDGYARVDELSDWLRYAWFARMGDEKTKQLCRFLDGYWELYPSEATALRPNIDKARKYLSQKSGLTVSREEAEAALELWDFTEGDV